jgi:hypothetical protein
MEADSASVAARSETSIAPSAATSGPSSGSAAACSTSMVVAQARAPTGFFNCGKCRKTVGPRKYSLQEIIKKIFLIYGRLSGRFLKKVSPGFTNEIVQQANKPGTRETRILASNRSKLQATPNLFLTMSAS